MNKISEQEMLSFNSPLHLQSASDLHDEYMESFSSFFSKGQALTACFLCWIRIRLDCRCRLASAEAEAAPAVDASAVEGEGAVEDIEH